MSLPAKISGQLLEVEDSRPYGRGVLRTGRKGVEEFWFRRDRDDRQSLEALYELEDLVQIELAVYVSVRMHRESGQPTRGLSVEATQLVSNGHPL